MWMTYCRVWLITEPWRSLHKDNRIGIASSVAHSSSARLSISLTANIIHQSHLVQSSSFQLNHDLCVRGLTFKTVFDWNRNRNRSKPGPGSIQWKPRFFFSFRSVDVWMLIDFYFKHELSCEPIAGLIESAQSKCTNDQNNWVFRNRYAC